MSITGNEYQKNLFRTGIKASPGIEQRKTEKKDALLEDATITMEQRDLERSMQ